MSGKKKKKRLALLSKEEDQAWESEFLFNLDEGASEATADRRAAKAVKKQFPRLKEFDGFHPGSTLPKGKVSPAECSAIGGKMVKGRCVRRDRVV